MAVKYLRRAQDGATTDPNAIDLSQYMDDPEFTAIMNKLGIIKAIQDIQQGNQGPVTQMLQEQRLRAQAQAESIPAGAEYYPGLEPGGLFDAIVAGIGGGAGLEMGARKVNRVSLDSLGSSLADAMWAAKQSADSGTSGSATPGLAEDVNTLVKQALDYVTGRSQKNTEAAGSSTSGPQSPFYTNPPVPEDAQGFQPEAALDYTDARNARALEQVAEKMRQFSDQGDFDFLKGIADFVKRGSTRPYKDGGRVEGPALLHVGERSPKDKKYETSEVVLAAPGTVVAPIPKGMPVNEENALALILSQVMKNQSTPTKRGVRGSQGGSVTTPYDSTYILGLLGAGNTLRANNQQYDLGLRSNQLGINTLGFNERNSAADRASSEAIARANRAASERTSEASSRAAMTSANNQRYAADLAYRQAMEDRSQALAIAQLNDQTRRIEAANQMQYWLGQLGIGRGQLDVARQQESFNELSRGVGEAASPGVRAGRLPTSAF